jgi:hypothetical protein
VDEEKRWMDMMMKLVRKTAEEELKVIEMQNLYESTRNEHTLYTRHILQLRVGFRRHGCGQSS